MSQLFGPNHALSHTVQHLFQAALSEKTKAAYCTGFKRYSLFLTLHGVTWISPLPPINENYLIYFVAHCFQVLKLAHGTIKLYLCGVRFTYVSNGHGNPLCNANGDYLPGLATVLRAVKRLVTIITTLRQGVFSPFTDLLMEAACTSAFFAFLRCGEFTVRKRFNPALDLTFANVHIEADIQTAFINLQASKADPFRQGVSIQLFCTDREVCPVHSLVAYRRERCKFPSSSSSPFFLQEDGAALSRVFFVGKLKEVLSRLSLDPSLYNGHSFRIGAATTAAAAQVEDHLIQTLGRWSSNCYSRYIRTDQRELKTAHLRMCQPL